MCSNNEKEKGDSSVIPVVFSLLAIINEILKHGWKNVIRQTDLRSCRSWSYYHISILVVKSMRRNRDNVIFVVVRIPEFLRVCDCMSFFAEFSTVWRFKKVWTEVAVSQAFIAQLSLDHQLPYTMIKRYGVQVYYPV